ncbi:OmpW family protein [Polynucleobacter sp. 73C-SIWE]|uniref:OmpW/AlkL family protein n=1 Tax=Polynucleobacter sp. 73C-SIWE TaxID=2689098 RepID=UPI001C0B38F4|nr:OmpW family outer membrane protein [Polynucleobacter sp. 73C-SIWE]MBU3580339.1 OmpW family protein [Polynucleobacter sp. 73C-SIWE]
MRLKSLVVAMAAVASLAPIAAHAQSAEENPWMVRVRAVDLLWQNGQSGAVVQGADVKAANKVIPELDVSYFFTKNIAAELVLTYPQTIDINYTSSQTKLGSIKALPPSLLLQYHFTNFGAFKPYIGAGVNYTIFTSRNNLGNGAYSVDNSSFGAVGQIGMDYMFDKNWGLNLDLKYATMSTNVTTAAGADGGKLTLNPWMPAVGVTYKF